ncbi:hypothetical protein A6770_27720 [Nostoc minutum NIES-26]|uniref:Uncharacterized protein n=1 Tax=Nostoc minutum NIES-26 TaxID=1844469 RepID=A0A367QN48_9NOSO|nr:hypothetical protein A6770_27720 [Nostoc minutum NIES-26]
MESPKQSSNFREKAVKRVFWSAIESWRCQTISFSVFWLVAGILGSERFRLIALLGLFVAFVGLIIERGFATAIVQGQKLKLEYFNTGFKANLILTVFQVTLSLACADWTKSALRDRQAINFLSVSA